jgi:hypothetical protein
LRCPPLTGTPQIAIITPDKGAVINDWCMVSSPDKTTGHPLEAGQTSLNVYAETHPMFLPELDERAFGGALRSQP